MEREPQNEGFDRAHAEALAEELMREYADLYDEFPDEFYEVEQGMLLVRDEDCEAIFVRLQSLAAKLRARREGQKQSS